MFPLAVFRNGDGPKFNMTCVSSLTISYRLSHSQEYTQGEGGKAHPPPLWYFLVNAKITVSINQSTN
ncbi:hypothetical protein E2C01_015401 [Portunus trituberculatus]|uniref:Uncharacterized protein n=1 Tax=Portunus trituberculatus TaxID=210409 RepID=A0A5B7DMN0_PORTR|nr:hypothetical protein [Portunus trituberculatus]